jgi:hypothetical protein
MDSRRQLLCDIATRILILNLKSATQLKMLKYLGDLQESDNKPNEGDLVLANIDFQLA